MLSIENDTPVLSPAFANTEEGFKAVGVFNTATKLADALKAKARSIRLIPKDDNFDVAKAEAEKKSAFLFYNLDGNERKRWAKDTTRTPFFEKQDSTKRKAEAISTTYNTKVENTKEDEDREGSEDSEGSEAGGGTD
ncbi:hypothetical protein IFR05_010418 [Cadophora sp. M221]|nr:hypothetical protein IFR05_010418 [Cadophora sp. M221]